MVDNGSGDETIAVAKSFGAAVIELGSNQGFAAAVNAGIEAAQSDWILVLNNDVELGSRWLEYALAAAAAERSSLVTGKLVQARHPERLDGTWDLAALSGCAWRCGWNAPDGSFWDERRPAPLVPFTACLIHRTVFAAVGTLDTNYGSYYEDVDFGVRCALAGFTGVYEPKARGVHQGSATLGAGARTSYLISRNQVLFASKFGLRKVSLLRVVVGQSLFLLTRIRQGGFFAALRGKWDGFQMARRFERPAVAPEQLRALLALHEKQIFQFQAQLGWDLSWKIYFSVLGCG